LKQKCEINIFTDSKYVADSISNGWALNWKKENWRKKNKKVPNADLWDILLGLVERHIVNINWVRGHNGHLENEECDKMAVDEIKKQKGKYV
jgi:ribonuclease HI